MHAPQHIDVKRRPVHRQTGGLRVHAAEDAFHACVEKQTGRRRLAQDNIFKIWGEQAGDGLVNKNIIDDVKIEVGRGQAAQEPLPGAPDIPIDIGKSCSEISTLPVCKWPLMEVNPAARSALMASRICRPNFEMLGACIGSAWSYLKMDLVRCREVVCVWCEVVCGVRWCEVV